MVFGFIGPTEVIVILVIALLVFGPQKLPEIGRQIGSAYREMNRMRNEVTRALEFESYTQPYDMPTYESPTNGQTYAYDGAEYNYAADYEAQNALQIAPPGPRLEQSNVRMLSESEMSGSYTTFEANTPEETGTVVTSETETLGPVSASPSETETTGEVSTPRADAKQSASDTVATQAA